MTTKVLIINVHSTRNAGDAALAHMTLEQLQEHLSPIQITLSMDDPASYSGKGDAVGSLVTWLKEITPAGRPRWNKLNLIWLVPACLFPILSQNLFKRANFAFTPRKLHKLLIAYLNADLVVSEAGGFLYHSGSGLTLLLTIFSLALALICGKPLYLFPQSMGPFNNKWECKLLRLVLNKARVVMVREPISLQQLVECGVKGNNCVLIPDLAFGFKSASAVETEAWFSQQGIDLNHDRPLLGVTLINWGAQNNRFGFQDRYEMAVLGATRYFIEHHGGKVVFIPQVWGPLPSQDDRVPARRVAASLLDLEDRVHLINDPLPPGLLKAIYGRMDLFIGTRMHSNIFALSEGVPVIAIGYQHKTKGIARMLGQEKWVIDIDQVNDQNLIALLQALIEQREVQREKILVQLPEIILQTKQAGEILAKDYRRWIYERQNG